MNAIRTTNAAGWIIFGGVFCAGLLLVPLSALHVVPWWAWLLLWGVAFGGGAPAVGYSDDFESGKVAVAAVFIIGTAALLGFGILLGLGLAPAWLCLVPCAGVGGASLSFAVAMLLPRVVEGRGPGRGTGDCFAGCKRVFCAGREQRHG